MAVGDVYQVVDTQTQFGQTELNVYYYQVQSESISDNNAQSVCNAFITHVIPVVTPIQDLSVVHTSVSAKNLFNESDAHTELISLAGTAGGSDPMTTFNAFGFRMTGVNHAVRNGEKRIPGVVESQTTDGIFTGSGVVTALNAVAAILFSDMPWGLLAAEVLIPVIVKRIKDGSSYRLPATSEEAVLSHIVDATFSPLVTSQVSRKVGRGE